MYDDAAKHASKHFFELPAYRLSSILEPHAAAALYLYSATGEKLPVQPSGPDRVFHTNNEIWEQLYYDQLRRTNINITLDSFFIFEWFPRSPGLYYTPNARAARKEAQRQVMSMDKGIIVYNHDGKMSMLDGGVGNIRMKPIAIGGIDHYFVSASSSGNCEEGFPAAIPVDFYNQVIDEIAEHGTIVKSLTGKLQHIPNNLEGVYDGYTGVSKVFLQVHQLSEPKHPKSRRMEDLSVSVAVSFVSSFQGPQTVYASYVTFDPSSRKSFEDSIRWMEDEYVVGLYKGRIITDFDQIRPRFKDAPFSLSKVMGLSLNLADLDKLDLAYNFSRITEIQRSIKVTIDTFNYTHMEEHNKYKTVNSQVAAMGDNAHAENVSQQQRIGNDIDLNALAEELSKLRQEAKKESSEPAHDEQIGALAAAESAAKQGDKSKVLAYLAKAGKWTLGIAEKIGTGLAVAMIKEAIKP